MMLSKNFHLCELICKCGCESHSLTKLKELATNLQHIRDLYDSPIWVNSAYRCPKHNAAVGGVVHSTHTRHLASDLRAVNQKHQVAITSAIHELIADEIIPDGGLCMYDSFIHVDFRGERSRW